MPRFVRRQRERQAHLEGVAGFDRNRWPTSVGTGGRFASESVADLARITHSVEHGATQVRVLDTIRASHASPGLLQRALQIEQYDAAGPRPRGSCARQDRWRVISALGARLSANAEAQDQSGCLASIGSPVSRLDHAPERSTSERVQGQAPPSEGEELLR